MVLASTRIVPSSSSCGPRVHPRMWFSRPPAYVVLASTRFASCSADAVLRQCFRRRMLRSEDASRAPLLAQHVGKATRKAAARRYRDRSAVGQPARSRQGSRGKSAEEPNRARTRKGAVR